MEKICIPTAGETYSCPLMKTTHLNTLPSTWEKNVEMQLAAQHIPDDFWGGERDRERMGYGPALYVCTEKMESVMQNRIQCKKSRKKRQKNYTLGNENH